MIRKIEELSEGIWLTGARGERRRLTGYQGALPQSPLPEDWGEEGDPGDGDPESALVPYCIVRTAEVDFKEDGEEARVYLVFCLYDRGQAMEGTQAMWNLLNRITGYFRQYPVLDAFWCGRKMKAVIQEEDTYPYFFGGIEMTWNLPGMECEG